jgi:hypothetical protein
MGIRMALSLPLLAGLALAALAVDTPKHRDHPGGKHAGLAQFQQLAGQWVGKARFGEAGDHEVRAIYKVTSGGSAIVETLFPDTEREMVTIIHQDGDDLALTHYCHLGNQPHMRTKGQSDGTKVAFKYSGASNLKSDKDKHMHEVTYTFVDKDTLKSEWTLYDNGKTTATVVMELKRVK